jgi:hypothetical protein
MEDGFLKFSTLNNKKKTIKKSKIMTKEQAKDILFVIEEFAQGKKIKVPNQHGEWVEQLDVSFEDNYTKYRIVNEDKVNSWSIPDRMSCYNLFVYGTLALKEKQDELGLTYQSCIEYDYVKGYSLNEIEDEGIYLQARKNYSADVGIITGRILLNCNLEQCIDRLDEWEGEQYQRQVVTTVVNGIECIMYVLK